MINITYLLGNGFDISLGLQTTYRDFYEFLIRNNPNDIKHSRLFDNIKSNISMWSDFELQLGSYVKYISSDPSLNKFIEEKYALEAQLRKYLRLQEDRITWNRNLLSEAGRAFYEALTDVSYFEDIFDNEINIEDKKIINIINFNYTNIIEKLLQVNPIDKNLYLHGKLDDTIILGVNSIEQIDNQDYKNNPDLKLAMCKREMMQHDSKKRFSTAQKILEETDYVVLYGTSIGETDRIWWDLIIESLKKEQIQKVVIIAYEANRDPQNRHRDRQIKEEVTELFLTKEHYNDRVLQNKIEVLINTPIFNAVQQMLNINKKNDNKEKLAGIPLLRTT